MSLRNHELFLNHQQWVNQLGTKQHSHTEQVNFFVVKRDKKRGGRGRDKDTQERATQCGNRTKGACNEDSSLNHGASAPPTELNATSNSQI